MDSEHVTTAEKRICEPGSLMERLRVLITKKQKKPKKIFEPVSIEETLRGWLLHAHKARDRHDEAARRYDRYHYWFVGVPTIALSAIASISTSLEERVGTQWEQVGPWLGPVSIITAGLAVVFASLQTSFNFGKRAESHRIAGVEYKIIIRELEQELAKPDMETNKRNADWLKELKDRLDKLEKEAPVVPGEIYSHIEKKYDCVDFAKTVKELS